MPQQPRGSPLPNSSSNSRTTTVELPDSNSHSSDPCQVHNHTSYLVMDHHNDNYIIMKLNYGKRNQCSISVRDIGHSPIFIKNV